MNISYQIEIILLSHFLKGPHLSDLKRDRLKKVNREEGEKLVNFVRD